MSVRWIRPKLHKEPPRRRADGPFIIDRFIIVSPSSGSIVLLWPYSASSFCLLAFACSILTETKWEISFGFLVNHWSIERNFPIQFRCLFPTMYLSFEHIERVWYPLSCYNLKYITSSFLTFVTFSSILAGEKGSYSCIYARVAQKVTARTGAWPAPLTVGADFVGPGSHIFNGFDLGHPCDSVW